MILDEVKNAIRKYVVLPDEESLDAVVLYVAATWAQPVANAYTRLVVKAPAKQCGKSRLLDVIETMAFHAIIAGDTSPAALIASLDPDEPPTLMLDEMDTVFNGKANEALRRMLNIGHQKRRPYRRMHNGVVVERSTYAMAVLAGIGDLPDTIEDRAVIINMRRRGPGEHVEPYRVQRDEPGLKAIGFSMGAWVREGIELIGMSEPQNPLEDRAADNWDLLLRIAEYAGDEWAARGRKACIALDKAAAETRVASRTEKLLSDLRSIFAGLRIVGESKIFSEDLVTALQKADPEAWEAMEPRLLARMLHPYGVKPKVMRIPEQEGTRHGYESVMFNDTFGRYLKPVG
jgi:hypothetical protein